MQGIVQKNNEYEVDIIDNGFEGEGIAKIDGFTIFVKGAIKGEKSKIKIIKVNKDYAFAKIIEIIERSSSREEPMCSAFGRCGGCSLQHMNYDTQLTYKTESVKNTLKKTLGYDVKVNDIIGMGIPYTYRNKAQYPVVNDKIGFYADRSHNLIESNTCHIQNKVSDKIARDVFEITRKFKISSYNERTRKGILRHIVTRVGVNSNEIMVILVTSKEKVNNIEKVKSEIVNKYPEITSIVQNINEKDTNVILGEKCIVLYGKEYISDNLGEYKFKISPLSFYQINPIQTEVLYNIAKDYAELNGEEIVFDLYSGIGTISIFVAENAKKVYGIEIVKEAVQNAKENVELNEMRNIEFIEGEAERIAKQLYEEGIIADVVFVDPPRKGCDEKLLETIVNMRTKKVIYISCNPATLARDLRYLLDKGYEIKEVQPVDMFPQTSHVECVCSLKLK